MPRNCVMCAWPRTVWCTARAPSRFNHIWENFRVRPYPEVQNLPQSPTRPHLGTWPRPTSIYAQADSRTRGSYQQEKRPRGSAVTDSRRKRRIETRRRFSGGSIVSATKVPYPIFSVIYISGHWYDSRAVRVCVRKIYLFSVFILLVLRHMSDLMVSNATGTLTCDVFV